MPTAHSIILAGTTRVSERITTRSIWPIEKTPAQHRTIRDITEARRRLIARFTIGIAQPAESLAGLVSPFVGNPGTAALKRIILQKAQCNIAGMLWNFAEGCAAHPIPSDTTWIEDARARLIDRTFANPEFLGIRGLSVIAMMESCTEILAPVLAGIGKKLGCGDTMYPQQCTAKCRARIINLTDALQAEMNNSGDLFGQPVLLAEGSMLDACDYICRVIDDSTFIS